RCLNCLEKSGLWIGHQLRKQMDGPDINIRFYDKPTPYSKSLPSGSIYLWKYHNSLYWAGSSDDIWNQKCDSIATTIHELSHQLAPNGVQIGYGFGVGYELWHLWKSESYNSNN